MGFWSQIFNVGHEPGSLPAKLEALDLDPSFVAFSAMHPDEHAAWNACPRFDWMLGWLGTTDVSREVITRAVDQVISTVGRERPGILAHATELRSASERYLRTEGPLTDVIDALFALAHRPIARRKSAVEIAAEKNRAPSLFTLPKWLETSSDYLMPRFLQMRGRRSPPETYTHELIWEEMAAALHDALPWDVVAPHLTGAAAAPSPYR